MKKKTLIVVVIYINIDTSFEKMFQKTELKNIHWFERNHNFCDVATILAS